MARKIRPLRRELRIPSYAILGLLLLLTLWAASAIRIAKIPSKSMQPTLQPGDLVMMRIDAYRHRLPQRGEIVIFHDEARDELLAKRVIGLPGENVFTVGGQVWIDDVQLDESYARDFYSSDIVSRAKLGEGELWVMGDNRDGSSDSRDFGPIDRAQLRGRAASVIWPAEHRGRLVAPKYK